jgi:hypothetical protein
VRPSKRPLPCTAGEGQGGGELGTTSLAAQSCFLQALCRTTGILTLKVNGGVSHAEPLPASLQQPASISDPAGYMTALGIIVRPMHDAAALVPFVFAVELDGLAGTQSIDAWSKIDVVRDQNGLT